MTDIVPFSSESDILFRWISSENTENCIPTIRESDASKKIFTQLFSDIETSVQTISQLKRKKGIRFYNVKYSNISNKNDVPKPDTFNMSSIPKHIRDYINTDTKGTITYTTTIKNKKFTAIFVVENIDMYEHIGIYNKYFDRMVTWLNIGFNYSSGKCGNDLTVYLYFSPFEKKLPDNFTDIIGQDHANTAFTYTCPSDKSEIVIFRQEEWFKVFIHETFHLLSLDFSGMNADDICKQKMSEVFNIKSDFKLFETYTETWAVIIHTCFCSYFCLEGNKDLSEFLKSTKFLLRFEIMFKIFQMHKILSFMGLTYDMFLDKSLETKIAQDTLYHEKTNVFAYHIACTITLCKYVQFIEWCDTNNMNFLQFKKSIVNVNSFCESIISWHNDRHTLRTIHKITKEGCFKKMINNVNNKENRWIRDTMRMTICEIN